MISVDDLRTALGDRFADKIVVEWLTGCWVWTACKVGNGYASYKHEGRMIYSHRLVYETLVGPISNGFQLDHLCRNRACVNPAHLESTTRRENISRGRLADLKDERSSPAIGVSWNKGRWVAKIVVAGRQRYIGQFTTHSEAAFAYDVLLLLIDDQLRNKRFYSDELSDDGLKSVIGKMLGSGRFNDVIANRAAA